MQIVKTKEGTKYKYSLIDKNKEIAYTKGLLHNEPIVLSLYEFHTENKLQEKISAKKLGVAFFEDCQKNDSTIIVTVKDSTKKAEWFLQENNFNHIFTRYVFENDLKNLKNPSQAFELKPFKEVALSAYQKIFFESSKGDSEAKLSRLTHQQFYDQEKIETGDLWDENLLHLVYFENNPIGILNLRTEHHYKTKILEGSINYIGLLKEFRNQGLGSALHLTGLHQLKQLGCENYFGGTNSNNQAMLTTFKKNNCVNTLTQHSYKSIP